MKQLRKCNYAVGILCAVIICIALFVRWRLLDIPLERDEGEYAYAGQIIVDGGKPYQDIYNMKFPGTYFFYALIMHAFGQTVTAIHLGVLLLNLVTCFFIYKTGRLLYNANTGFIAASCYAILSTGKEVLGVQANAEHFVLVFAIPAFFLLIKSIQLDRPKLLIASGLLYGMSIMMKQHGAFLALSSYIILLLYGLNGFKARIGRIVALSTGMLLPFFIWSCWSVHTGTFNKFYFLTFKYAQEYVSYNSLQSGLTAFKESFFPLSKDSVVFWIFSSFGLLSFFFNKALRPYFFLMLTFTFFSLIAVCPGFYFRPHYWLLLLPAISILAATFLATILEIIQERCSAFTSTMVFALVLSSAIIPYLYINRGYFFSSEPSEVLFELYGITPFSYAEQIGEYVKQRTRPDDHIAVVASEPEIFFYSNRKSATGYIYIYPILEENRYANSMLKELKMEIEKSNPVYVVYSNYPGTWPGNQEIIQELKDWFRVFTAKNYELVSIYELNEQKKLVIAEGEWALNYKPSGEVWTAIYKRNSR